MTDVYEYFQTVSYNFGTKEDRSNLNHDKVKSLFDYYDVNKLTILPEDGTCGGNTYIYEREVKIPAKSNPNFYFRVHGSSSGSWLVSISLLEGIEPALKAIPGKPVIVESSGKFYDVVYGVKEDLPK